MLDERKWPLAWLDDQVATGQATALGNDKACIVVALRQYPGGLVEVHGLCAAGDMHEVVKLVREAEQWGRQHGAILGSIASRRGWARVLSDYTETQVTIEKDL